VAVFSYIFSLLYPQNCKILMFFAITGAIWLGGAGAVIIGGLYWRWGTAPAAFASIIVGAVFGLAGLIVPPIYKHLYQHEFPVNNQWLYFMSMCLAIVVYVGVSLVARDKRRPFNLDNMLHRGAYSQTDSAESKHTVSSIWLKLLGITPPFTLGDRLWVIASLIWNFGWLAVFILGTLANMFWPLSDSLWMNFWRVYVLLYFVVGCPTTVWFSIGGLRDIRDLLRTLDSTVRNHADDGRVVHDATTEKVHEKSLDRVVGEEASC
jgi:SSS family solute:Na+ symporter